MRATSRPEGPRLTLLPGGAAAGATPSPVNADCSCSHQRDGALAPLAVEVATLLAETTGELISQAPLSLPLALSACMARRNAGADDLVQAMRLVRRALLGISTLDPTGEPVPFLPAESRRAAIEYAAYLHGLFDRAAAAGGTDRDALASRTLAALG